MSRSHRKTPIIGRGGGSEKYDKRIWHGRMRAHENALCRNACVSTIEDVDDLIFPQKNDVSNVWSMSKDGKGYNTYDQTIGWTNWRTGEFIPYWETYYKYYRAVLAK